MKKITLLIHVDALRHDYVTSEDMPFVSSLAATGIQARLIPPFGFEPDGAYLTGSYPENYEGGVHFVYNEGNQAIRFTKHLPHFLDYLNVYAQYPLRRSLQWFISHDSSVPRIRKQPFIGQIPFSLLRYFYFCETRMQYEEGFVRNAPTVYDYLRERNLGFYHHGVPEFSCSANAVRDRFMREFHGDVRFAFLLISDLDIVGHNFGPESAQRHRAATRVDQVIHEIYRRLTLLYDVVDVIAFGDHGSVPVDKYVDFRPMLWELPLVIGKDYIYFLDSTFARFWFFNENAERIIKEKVEKIEHGHIVTEQERLDYHIRYSNRKFGDLIYWTDGGTMIFPNFWHVHKKKKGMHGYPSEVLDNHAAFVFHTTEKSIGADHSVIEMPDVFQTVMYSLFSQPIKQSNVYGSPVQQTAPIPEHR